MKCITLSFCFALLAAFATGQNLVPNPSFEDTSCTSTPGDLTLFRAAHWFNPNIATPDYYGTSAVQGCVTSIYNNTWVNSGEWQFPRTGDKMIGLFAIISGSCSRDYVQCKLLEPLVQDESYCLELFISLSNRSMICTDCFGAVFTADSLLNLSTFCELGAMPTVTNPSGSLLNDTTEWMMVSGQFTAMGGERYLTIGNLLADENCTIAETSGTKEGFDIAYYFVDDVNLWQCTAPHAGNRDFEPFSLLPNPSDGMFKLVHPLNGSISIYNVSGQQIGSIVKNEVQSQIELSISGIYTVVFIPDGGFPLSKKLVIK